MASERVTVTKRLKNLGWVLLSLLLAVFAVVQAVATEGSGRGPGKASLAIVFVGAALLLGSALAATGSGDAASSRRWRLRLLWSGLLVAFVLPAAISLID